MKREGGVKWQRAKELIDKKGGVEREREEGVENENKKNFNKKVIYPENCRHLQ